MGLIFDSISAIDNDHMLTILDASLGFVVSLVNNEVHKDTGMNRKSAQSHESAQQWEGGAFHPCGPGWDDGNVLHLDIPSWHDL